MHLGDRWPKAFVSSLNLFFFSQVDWKDGHEIHTCFCLCYYYQFGSHFKHMIFFFFDKLTYDLPHLLV